jgi:nucleoside 2-deoxyribosyltransferase
MERDYREIEGRNFRRVVEEDKGDIDSCDIVLASCHRPSFGTSMELLYAWERDKDVYAISDNDKISPWLLYHSKKYLRALMRSLAI